MNKTTPNIADKKNQWLLGQVDVDYPTPESLLGRDLYLNSLDQKEYQQLNMALQNVEGESEVVDEIYLVDFHRLTIMFSILQSKKWDSKQDQANIIEFLTQIILSKEHELFVGFKSGAPVASAIVSKNETECLVSDVYFTSEINEINNNNFIIKLLGYWNENRNYDGMVWVERQ